MILTFDRNLFTQTTLDSGALTMLDSVTHPLPGSGEYRGVVYRESAQIAEFYVTGDDQSPVASVNIDLASFDTSVAADPPQVKRTAGGECGCSSAASSPKINRFTLNSKGYLVFHVSAGKGNYAVTLRKASQDPNTVVFDTRKLSEADIFSASIIRPGQYSVENTLTKATAQITVPYPKASKTAYRPPRAITFECDNRSIEPQNAEVQPGQGIHFRFKSPARIAIHLSKPDDGPGRSLAPKHLVPRVSNGPKKR